MGQVLIKAGVLRKEHQYYGASTLLPGEGFFSERIVQPVAGYYTPYNDQGLGSPTEVGSFTQVQFSSASKPCVDFFYYVNQSTKYRFSITCNSAEFYAAFESTDAHNQVNLAVFTGSGYTIKG